VRKTIDGPDTLEPGLAKMDKRVLAAIPECGEIEQRLRKGGEAVTVWQVGEALDTLDLVDLRRTLNGLEHLGYVEGAGVLPARRVYWRTRKGDEVLA
jgi:hypothetical protein